MMKRIILTIFHATAIFLLTGAQSTGDGWTLEQCVDYALENNISIKRERLNAELFQKDYQQSKYDLLPNLYAGATHEISSGRSLNIETYEWEDTEKQQGNMGLQSRLVIFNGLENYNRIKMNQYMFWQALEDLEKAKNDISLNIATYYLQILFDEEILQLAKNTYEVTLMQAEKTRRLVEVGNQARGDYLEIMAQAASDKLEVTNAQNNLKLSILELTQILDLDSVGDFSVYKPVDLSIESMGEPEGYIDVYNVATDIMPEIKGAQYEVLALEKSLSVSRGRRYPEVYLDALYYSRYLQGLNNPLDTIPPFEAYDYIDQVADNQYKQFSIGISIPIFTRFNTQTQIGKSKIALEDARYALEQRHQVLYKQIQEAHSDAMAALQKYESAHEAVKSNEEAFNYTQQRFEVGLVNSVDFNIAKNNLAIARSQLAQAKYEYIFKMLILDFYQGKPLKL